MGVFLETYSMSSTTLTQTDVNRFTRKLYNFLDRQEHTIKLTKHHTFYAQITYPKNDTDALVTIDYRRDILSCLIHEVLHHYYPKWSEKKVLRMEAKIINRLTERQAKNIVKKLALTL